MPKKWLPVNSSVNTQVDYGNGTTEQQEPLQSQEESSDATVQSQELLSQSEYAFSVSPILSKKL